MNRMSGKLAVITAGGQAIARGIAARFAEEGATVIVVDRDAEAGHQTVAQAGRDTHFLEADIRDRAAIAGALSEVGRQYGRIDALVIGGEDAPPPESWNPLESKTEAELDQALRNDVHGTLWTLQAALPWMRERGGAVLMLFSPFGQYASRFIGEHMAGRWGALGLARSAGHEWGRYQIRVNTLVPLADTPVFREYRRRHPEAVDQRLRHTALKRAGDPVRDIGGAAVFLCTDDTRFVTGQVVYADGGGFMTTPVFEPLLGE
jgi:NAD(P)-dependent dehydrogenase (short-subunit alcohol dehydrogenase family)